MNDILRESPLPPSTITITVPVLDQTATDALSELLHKLGYDQVIFENVTRITATRSPNDVISE